MQKLPSESIDLLLTDPPYGYSFLGKDWDRAVPRKEIWQECLRLLKPGSFAFIMSAPRLDCLSRMSLNLSQAGFDISFTPIFWAYRSGFPKALDISKVIDRRLGVKRKVLNLPGKKRSAICWGENYENRREVEFTLPESKEAQKLSGAYAGYQPKPAVEIVIVAMKPLSEKSYTDQALKNRKGVTWIKDCEIPDGDGNNRFPSNLLCTGNVFSSDSEKFDIDMWFSERVSSLPDHVKGTLPFLFVKKPSKGEKESGCEGIAPKRWCDDEAKVDIPQKRNRSERHNYHPTVKPVKLMSYLTVLGSRLGDTVLDPFIGSGTLGIASELLERRWIGIELEKDYAEIAASRLSSPGFSGYGDLLTSEA